MTSLHPSGRGAVRVALAILTAASLAACAAGPRVIERPTPVPCVTGDVPDEPRHVQGDLTGDSGRDIGIIAASALELRAWGRSLLGIVEACRANPH
jgi:hypothetical protein